MAPLTKCLIKKLRVKIMTVTQSGPLHPEEVKQYRFEIVSFSIFNKGIILLRYILSVFSLKY
jgi:hypothetical protein